MSNIETGGPAFPQVATNSDGDLYQPGMTLRDYFAAKAMAGYLASPTYLHACEQLEIAMSAYQMADAMLQARES